MNVEYMGKRKETCKNNFTVIYASEKFVIVTE